MHSGSNHDSEVRLGGKCQSNGKSSFHYAIQIIIFTHKLTDWTAWLLGLHVGVKSQLIYGSPSKGLSRQVRSSLLSSVEFFLEVSLLSTVPA